MTGVLPVDKPEGPTSHDVVAMARRALRIRRIGHTGTLDPFATGLLLLCIGPATRLAEYLTGLDKRYVGTARLGATTDTLDRTGSITAENDGWRDLAHAEVRSAFESQVGSVMQSPPAFSAKKLAGRRAYERARAGEAVAPDPVSVSIQALDVTGIEGDLVHFRIHCSSGTYVRAVARDAGERLGVGAHLSALRRTAIGRFEVGSALPVGRLDQEGTVAAALIAPLDALSHLPRLDLDDHDVERVRHGRGLPAGDRTPGEGPVVLAANGRLLAVGEVQGRTVRPRKVFT